MEDVIEYKPDQTKKYITIFIAVTTIITGFFASLLDVSLVDLINNPTKYKTLIILDIFTWFIILFVLIPLIGYLFKIGSFKHGNYPFIIFRELPLIYKVNILVNVFEILLFVYAILLGSKLYQPFLIVAVTHLILIFSFYRKKQKKLFGALKK